LNRVLLGLIFDIVYFIMMRLILS